MNEDTPMFSVIVPVYNPGEYLTPCLDSILRQTYRDFELLLVDDGSTDDSGTICDQFEAQDARVQVFHQENQGVCSARNNGLRIAKGRYVLFVDADDLWSPDLLSTLGALTENEVDILSFSFCRFHNRPGDKDAFYQRIIPSGESGEAWLDKLFHVHALPLSSACVYGYRRAFLEETRLFFRTDVRNTEDFDFNMRCLPQAESVLGTDRILYHYRMREGSASHTLTPEGIMNVLEVHEWVFRRYPNAATANRYCEYAMNLAMFGDREKERDAITFIKKNWDIWQYASYWPCHLGRFLFRVLGCHNGSVVFRALVVFYGKLNAFVRGK